MSMKDALAERRNGAAPLPEVLGTWTPMDEEFAVHPLLQQAKSEVSRWKSETEVGLAEVTALERELGALKQRIHDLQVRSEARKEGLHQEAMAKAAKDTAELTKVRVSMQEAMAKARMERRKLQEEIQAKQIAAGSQEEEVAEAARAASSAVCCAVDRAVTVLQAGLQGEGSNAIFSTVDWLEAVSRAAGELGWSKAERFSRSGAWDVHGEEGIDLLEDLKASLAGDPCEAIRGNGALMLEQWVQLARSERVGTQLILQEEELVEQLHDSRSRSAAIQAELTQRRREATELQESVDLENFRTDVALREQNWLVPRVASVVQDFAKMPEERMPLDPPPGCEDGWPWEIPVADLELRRGKSASAYRGGYTSQRRPAWSP